MTTDQRNRLTSMYGYEPGGSHQRECQAEAKLTIDQRSGLTTYGYEPGGSHQREWQAEARLTIDQQSGLTIDSCTSGRIKTADLALIAAATPQRGRKRMVCRGFGAGAGGNASARGVIADSRMKLLKKNPGRIKE